MFVHGIWAPLPAVDRLELPFSFVAMIFAKTLEPLVRSNGEAESTD